METTNWFFKCDKCGMEFLNAIRVVKQSELKELGFDRPVMMCLNPHCGEWLSPRSGGSVTDADRPFNTNKKGDLGDWNY